MARPIQDITHDVAGQTLELRVPQGRPTSATFKVLRDYDSDDADGEFSGAADVDSVSTTVDLASGASEDDPQRINLSTTSGISVDRKYLIREGSKSEWVQPIEIVLDDYIRVRYQLQNDYTVAATFVSTTITADVDSTWIADLDNISDPVDPDPGYRVLWSIIVGGETHKAYSYFDVVRAPVDYDVDIADVNDRAPGLMYSLPTEYQVEQGRPLLDAAWKALKAQLGSHMLDVDAFRNTDVVNELVIRKALQILATGGWKPLGYDSNAQYVLDTRTDFDTFFQQNVSVTQKSKLATGNDGSASHVTALPFWSK